MTPKNILLLAGIAALVILFITVARENQRLTVPTVTGNDSVSAPASGPHLTVSPEEYDFGKILQSGGVVSKTFTVVNDGTEDVIIAEILASCSCTTAKIDTTTLQPGESGILTVVFDPNYHFEDEGRFFRTATIKSNILGKAPEAKIFVEVDYDLGKDALKFK